MHRSSLRSAGLSFLAAAAGILAIAATFDPSGDGLTARWYQNDPEGQRVELARTHETDVYFANGVRPLSRIVQGWDFERLPVPPQLPRLDVELEGTIRIPEGPPRVIEARSPNAASLTLGGRKPSSPLAPGVYPIRVQWQGAIEPVASLELLWAEEDQEEDLQRVPDDALSPVSSTDTRVVYWVSAGILALLLGLCAAGVAYGRGPVRRHRIILGAACVLILAGAGLRLYRYDAVPDLRENGDELFATWNGWQLLTDGRTRGWSIWFHQYGNQVDVDFFQYFSSEPWRIVSPYFEHPPGMHLLVGAAAKLGGASQFYEARLKHTRLVPVGLGILTMVLVFGAARELQALRGTQDAKPALFALLLYAFLPPIVLQSRVIKEEALLAPLALGALWAVARYERLAQNRWLLAAALLAGLCPVAKLPGLIIPGTLGLFLLSRGRLRPLMGFTAVAVTPLALFLLYAASVDWDLFLFTTTLQAQVRAAHWNLFPRFFSQWLINRAHLGAGWLLFLWLGLLVALNRSLGEAAMRRASLLLLPALLYLIGIALSSGSWTFGWYLWPVIPFLCIGGGYFMADLWRAPDVVSGVIFVFLLTAYAWVFAPTEAWSRLGGFLALFVLLLPFALSSIRASGWTASASRIACGAGVLFFLVQSTVVVLYYDEQEERGWQDRDAVTRLPDGPAPR